MEYSCYLNQNAYLFLKLCMILEWGFRRFEILIFSMKQVLVIIFFVVGITHQGKSQTAIQIYSMTDSLGVYCVTPAYSGVNLDAYAFGYPNGTVFSVYIDFGDGTDTTFNVTSWGNSTQYISAYPLHTYLFPGNYTVTAIVTGPDLNTDQLTQVDMVIVSNICENVQGKVYNDENTNCIYDPNEYVFKWVKVQLFSGSSLLDIFYTDANGNFSFNAPTGLNYQIVVDASSWIYPKGFVESCSNTGSVNFILNSAMNFEFPYECIVNGFDLTAGNIPGYGFVPGLIGYIKPYFYNNTCQVQSGFVDVTIDPLTTFITNTGTPPNLVNGNVLTWNFSNINNTNGWSALSILIGQIIFETSASVNIGDMLCFETDIFPVAGDNNPADNENAKCYPVVASFDPNMKEVSPAGNGPEGFIDSDLSMTYTIHFQNTGTAPAQNVYILDTLDADLDLSTLQIIAASHDMNLYAATNGVLKFDFPNIQLPDSSTNEPLSHGHVMYKIDQKSSLFPGTEIKNTAHIFFDYNEAVITNTTLNTISYPDGFSETEIDALKLYPNPTDGKINFTGTLSGEKFAIYDLTGKMIYSGTISLNQMDVSFLKNGMYLLEVSSTRRIKLEIWK